ncbi:MAG: YcaO-like family protein [Bacillota bacterium]
MVGTLDDFLTRAARFRSPRTGLVRNVLELFREPEDPYIFFAATMRATTSRYDLPVDMPARNGGAGLTPDQALAAALGETIERYACSVYHPDELILASYGELEGEAVHPRDLNPYAESQYANPRFPFRQMTEASRLRWMQGVRMSDSAPIWYPAGLAYIPYDWPDDELMIAPGVSTGMALGMSQIVAALAGICEVIERDAIMLHWWNRLPAPEVEVEPDSPVGRLMTERFSVPGVRYRLFDITSDIGVPTLFCTVEEVDVHEKGCAIAVGAATRPDPAQAAVKALVEAAQTHHFGRHLVRRDGHIPLEDGFRNVQGLDDHVRVYARPDMRHAFDFLHKNGRSVRLASLPNLEAGDQRTTLRRLVERVRSAGLEPIALDLTPPDVADEGLVAIKVAVPGMVDLNPWHALRWLGCRRLYEGPVRMGYRSTPSTEADLNPLPHPFP